MNSYEGVFVEKQVVLRHSESCGVFKGLSCSSAEDNYIIASSSSRAPSPSESTWPKSSWRVETPFEQA